MSSGEIARRPAHGALTYFVDARAHHEGAGGPISGSTGGPTPATPGDSCIQTVMAHSTEGGLAVVADHLKDQMFSSTTVVAIDSIIVTSLFGQRTRKKSKRTHGLQTLSIACNVDQKTKDTIYQTFESNKGQLLFEYPKAYLRAANTMAASLYRGCSPLKQHGSDSRAVVEWCAANVFFAVELP